MVLLAAVEPPKATPVRLCSVCQTDASKYKCPGCLAATCSLACSKQHKQQTGCSSKRDKLAFVPMQEFTDRHIMSDYRWLEEVNRVDDNAKRHRPPTPRRELPQHLGSLVHQARYRGVRLQIMPPGMQRRQTNSTRYDPRSRKLFWRLEWRFPAAATTPSAAVPAPAAAAPAPPAAGDAPEAAAAAAAAAAEAAAEAEAAAPASLPPAATTADSPAASLGESAEQIPQQCQQPTMRKAPQQQQQQQQQRPVVVYDGKVDEEVLLSTVLGRHLEYRQGAGAQALQLRAYRDAGLEALTVLMKKERCPANAVRYYRLDITQSLKSQLAGKLIIEYPTFLVLLAGAESAYDIITVKELQAEEQQRHQYQQGPRQQQQQQQQGQAGGQHHLHWPPPPPPPPRVPKPEQQQDPQQQQQQQQGEVIVGQDEPAAKRQCTGQAPVAAAAAAAAGQPAGQQQQQQPGANGLPLEHTQPQQQQTQQQQQQQVQQLPEQQQGLGQQQQRPQPKYYYYDPNAGLDEDAADCLAGLGDDLEDDWQQPQSSSQPAAAAAAAAAMNGVGGGGVAEDASGVMMALLGQYHDENEISIDVDGDDE